MFYREQFINKALQPLVWIFDGSNWIIAGTLREWGAHASFLPEKIPSGAPSSMFAIGGEKIEPSCQRYWKLGIFPQSHKHQLGTEAPLAVNHLKISLCMMLPGLRAGATAGHCLLLWWDCDPLAQKPLLRSSCQGGSSLNPFWELYHI